MKNTLFHRLAQQLPISRILIPFISLGLMPVCAAQDLRWNATWHYEYTSNSLDGKLLDGPMAVDLGGCTYMVSKLVGTIDVDPGSNALTESSMSAAPAMCLTKFGQDGTLLWTRLIDNGLLIEPEAIGVDELNNLYLTGAFRGTLDVDPGAGVTNVTSVGGADGFVLKFGLDGDLVWARTFGSPQNDKGVQMDVDPAGNMIILISGIGMFDTDPGPGVTLVQIGSPSGSVLSLNSDGNLRWARAYEGPIGSSALRSIAFDPESNVLLTGTFTGDLDTDTGVGIELLPYEPDVTNLFIAKWNENGDPLWAKRLTHTNVPRKIASDPEGNVLIVGNLVGPADIDPGPDVHLHSPGSALNTSFLLKLDPAGTYRWSRSWSASFSAQIYALDTDNQGNVIVCGQYLRDLDMAPDDAHVPAAYAPESQHSFISVLDPEGAYRWSGQWGYGTETTYLERIAVAPDNSIRISGWFFGPIDLDPGSGTNIFNGPMEDQSTILLSLSPEAMTGVNERRTENIALYPVPVRDVLNVAHARTNTNISLFDPRGALVVRMTGQGTMTTLDLSSLPSGHYTVRMESLDTVEVRSIVKL